MKQPTYCICTTPRSGSTHLTNLLGSLNLVGYPSEYYHYHDENESFEDFLESIVCNSDVFGFNIKYESLHTVVDLVDFKKLKCVWLKRHDVIAQAISLVKASYTNKYYLETGEERGPENFDVSVSEIERSVCLLTLDNALWLDFFQKNGIKPLVVHYEDFEREEGFTPTVTKILDFICADTKLASNTIGKKQADSHSEAIYDSFLDGYKDRDRV